MILLEHRDVYWKDALFFMCIGYLICWVMGKAVQWEQRRNRRKHS